MFKKLPRTNLSAVLWRLWGESYIAQSILTLGLPIMVGQLGSIAQQFADTMMVGRYGTTELAAAGFVNNVFNFVIYFILGISYASTPVIGAAFGRKDYRSVAQSLTESIVVNFLFSLFIVAGLLLLYYNIGVLHQPEEIIPTASPYFLILTASVPFMSVFNALKQYSDAVGETKIPMWIMLFANALNIFLNWLLIFGTFGCPELGLLGAGIATLVARVVSVIMMATAVFVLKKYRETRGMASPKDSANNWTVTLSGMKHLLLLGIPISIQLGLEASSFNICAIFMGWIGAIPLAAHQVMCTISTLCFQVVYGIGAASSVLISQFRGAADWYNVRRTATSAFFIGLTILVVMITLIYLLRYPLTLCFTTNEEVIGVVMSLLPCFFIYQFGDCMQITYANALRGIEQVRKMMLYAFIAYILVSIPLSYVFGFVLHLGAVGVWMGMPFGLTTAGLLFFSEFRKKCAPLLHDRLCMVG